MHERASFRAAPRRLPAGDALFEFEIDPAAELQAKELERCRRSDWSSHTLDEALRADNEAFVEYLRGGHYSRRVDCC